jgi:uncharacterized protein (TIGR03437 family)
VSEVALNPTISGDGKRLAFATRRRVTAASDGSVELYLYDIPTAEFTQLTAAPANAIAEVVSSLNDDGSVAVFNFPRLLANGDSGNETSNNCEIFLAYAPSRPPFSPMTVFNGASVAESTPIPVLPAGGIAIAMGHALANVSLHAIGTFPSSLAGTSITVAGFPAQLLFVSPTQVNFVVPSEAPPGLTDFVVTNADGFESRASALISNAAPGIFTTAGDGQGEGVILDAETSLVAPFDPTNGKLRLSIFATGVRNAANVSCVISGQAVPVEAVMSSPDLPGLDEVHVFIPRTLRGAGEVGLVIMADGVESNSVTTTLSGSSVRDIVINEILADPPDGLAGDANHDGVRGASDDEFVELVNSTTRDLDLSGFQLQTRALNGATDVVRHRFPVGTSLPGGTALVVFGGGNIDSSNVVFSGARVVRASTGGISLSNTGGIVSVQDNLGSIVTTVQFGTSVPANDNQSLTRSPDVTGAFVLHSLAPDSQQRAYSPGTRVSGAPFLPLQPSPTPAPTPLPTPSVTPSPFPDPSPSPSPGARVVITQVYGGGGNTGAAFRNDFLEIRNTGDAAVDLTGWSVQYTGATSNSWSVTNLTSVSLSPGQYYLIQEASGGTNGQNLPAADASGVINLAAGAGKVALVNTRTALTGACPVNSSIIDLVGYGSSANCFLGTGPAPAPSNSVALLRLASGCVDTQNNAMDFATGAPTPRNSSSELSPCTNASTKLSILPHKMQTHMPLQEGPVREADAGGFGFAALPLSVRKACGFPSGLPLLQREALPRAAARQSLGSFKKGPRRKARGFTHGRRQTRK